MGSAPVAAAPAPAGVKPQAVRFAAALLAYTKNGTLAEICTLFDISPHGAHRSGSLKHVLTFQKPFDMRLANRECPQHEGSVRDRFVTRD